MYATMYAIIGLCWLQFDLIVYCKISQEVYWLLSSFQWFLFAGVRPRRLEEAGIQLSMVEQDILKCCLVLVVQTDVYKHD